MHIPKHCKYCNKLISRSRKASASYCSDACYYEAKKERSSKQYSSRQAFIHPFNRNEEILQQFYLLYQLGQSVTYAMLDRLQFNWGISEGELQDSESNIWKIIGKYCYLLNRDKTIFIELCDNSN